MCHWITLFQLQNNLEGSNIETISYQWKLLQIQQLRSFITFSPMLSQIYVETNTPVITAKFTTDFINNFECVQLMFITLKFLILFFSIICNELQVSRIAVVRYVMKDLYLDFTSQKKNEKKVEHVTSKFFLTSETLQKIHEKMDCYAISIPSHQWEQFEKELSAWFRKSIRGNCFSFSLLKKPLIKTSLRK